MSSRSLGWSNLEMCAWRGETMSCTYETFGDSVIILHTGGAPKVSVKSGCHRGTHLSRPGMLTIIPPGTSTTWGVDGSVHGYSLHLSGSLFDGLGEVTARQINEFLGFRCGVLDPVLTTLVNALAAELAVPTQIGSLYAESLGDCIGLHIARSALRLKQANGLRGFPSKVIRTVLDEIEAHLEDGISLQELADSVGVSRTHFAKLFCQSIGVPPHVYITQRRISVAKVMLASGGRPLCDIALSCGFSSQAHFTEQFRRETGQTPGQYRRSSN
jgi:AraC family transcriptional regulator